MENLIELLEERNRHLRKFKKVNDVEMDNFCHGNFDNLENFYKTREGLLDVIRSLDELISGSNQEFIESNEINMDTKKVVGRALSEKTRLVTSILSQDLQILSFIEQAKSEMIKDLSAVKIARRAVGAYKSRGRS